MPTVVSCECGSSFQAADWLAGREVPCPSCGTKLVIPGPTADATEPAAEEAPAATAPAEKIVVACKCGKRFQASAKLLGKAVKCPGCGNPLKVQKAGTKPAAAKTAATKPTPAPRPVPAKPAPAKPAPSADPLAMDLSTFDSAGFDQAGFDQGGLGGAFDQGGLGGGGFDQAGFDQGGLGQAGFDQAGFGQAGFDQAGFGQAGLGSPMDNLSMGYGQGQPMGGDAGAYGHPGGGPAHETSGGGSFELSPKMLVVLMSVAGGAVALLLLAIFIPPMYRYLTTPAEVVVNSAATASNPTAADSSALNWMPFASPTGEYSADFPGTPVTTATTPNSFGALAGVDSPASVHLATRGQFSVGRMAMPNTVEEPAVRKMMVKAAMDAFTSSGGGQTVVSRKEITVGSNPGVEARIEGKNQQGQDYESNCRIVMTKSHVYYAIYAVPKGHFNSEDSNRFFGTFTITSPK